MLARSHFSVDLWFIFGSFCYGAEARIVHCWKDSLRLTLASASESACSELVSFFESINEKAKALVRTEIRIFVNSNPDENSQDWAEELVATLMTELRPKLISTEKQAEETLLLQLELPDVRGLTPNDQNTWDNLVTEIWPQLPA